MRLAVSESKCGQHCPPGERITRINLTFPGVHGVQAIESNRLRRLLF